MRRKSKEFEVENDFDLDDDSSIDDVSDEIEPEQVGSLDKDFDDDLKDDFYGGDFTDDFMGDEGITPINKHGDLLKELTNFSPYLKETFNNWLGIVWSESQNKYVQNADMKPIMSIQCAAWAVGFLKTYARSNNIITNIGYDEYKFIMQDIIEAIWLNLGTRDEFLVKEDGDLLRVANELEHAAALTLMGAGEGKYNAFLGTVTSRHETVNPMMMQQNPNQVQLEKNSGFLQRLKKAIAG